MALKEIKLSNLIDYLDDMGSDFADFFRPMLGYEAVLRLYDGIDDSIEYQLSEMEDETGYEFPPDLISFYMCTNGGEFGDLMLYPLTTDTSIEETIHKFNVLDSSLKESIGLDKKTLLIGKYLTHDHYITVTLNDDDVYSYSLYDAKKKSVIMEFEYLIQLIALEVSYVTEYDELMEYANSEDAE